jgi:predicted nucleic acid-binding protein
MTTALDSMVLIDLFQEEPGRAPRAANAIDRAIRSGRLVACEIAWAEVAGRFASAAVMAQAMAELSVEFDGMSEAAATKAGRLWRSFRQTGGGRRDRIVADFLVGAHALDRADALLTRDRGFYRRYFKGLQVIEP